MGYITGYLGFFNPSQSVVIPAGDTFSAPINCAGFCLTGIILPSLFTGTGLTFYAGDSSIGFQANGEILLTGTTSNNDTITINGTVITFKSSGPSGNQVLIGADAAGTAANLFAFLAASLNAGLAACTYSLAGDVITVLAIVHGTAGNAYTFAKSSSDITLTPSGGTLSGGGFRQLYDASNSAISMTVAQGRCYAVDPANFQGVQWLQIKSGTTETSARTLICSLKGL